MARRSKTYKQQVVVRAILASNLKALRDQHYRELDTPTARNKALARDADTTLSQIQRILKSQVGTGVDQLESLAQVFGVKPQDLITPYFTAETPPNPPAGAQPAPSLPRRIRQG
jgi:transcriptional regulator with XRE-family HTH domain